MELIAGGERFDDGDEDDDDEYSALQGDIMFNTRNKSGISAQPCIIVNIFDVNGVMFRGVNDLMFFFFSSHSLSDIQALNIWLKGKWQQKFLLSLLKEILKIMYRSFLQNFYICFTLGDIVT